MITRRKYSATLKWSETNAPAYYVSASVTKKAPITLKPGVIAIKLFTTVIYEG
jgi:hypothetical protein